MYEDTFFLDLKPLFEPDGVAIIGASNNPGKVGGMTMLSTLIGGFNINNLYPVNYNEDEIFGLKSYKNVKDIPYNVDLAIFCVPAFSVKNVIEDCVAKRVKFGVIISAGFSEIGEKGRIMEKEIVKTANNGGMRIIGPNCMGISSSKVHLHALMNMLVPNEGGISIVSQSGTIGSFTMANGSIERLGFSKFASSGDEADIHTEDLIEYMTDDDDTRVILAFIEGLRDGKRFLKIAKKACEKKPFIVVKGGITEEGAKAASSHTGSMAGSSSIYSALFKQTGIISATDVDDLVNLAKGFYMLPLPKGRGVGIVSAWGGIGVLTADACAREGLKVPSLSKETIDSLNELLPPFWSRQNPVDMTAAGIYGSWDLFIDVNKLVLTDKNIDAVICMIPLFTSLYRDVLEGKDETKHYAEGLVDFIEDTESEFVKSFVRLKEYNKPLIVLNIARRLESKSVTYLEKNGIPFYSSSMDAAHVLSKMVQYKEYLDRSNEE